MPEHLKIHGKEQTTMASGSASAHSFPSWKHRIFHILPVFLPALPSWMPDLFFRYIFSGSPEVQAASSVITLKISAVCKLTGTK